MPPATRRSGRWLRAKIDAGSGTGVPGVRCSDERRSVACSAANSPPSPPCSPTPPRTSWPSPPSHSSTGARSGPPTRSSGSTARSSGAETSSGSSPTTPASRPSSPRSSSRPTTSGPSPNGATCPTSPWPSSTAPTKAGRPLGSHHRLSRTVTRVDGQAGRRLRPPRGTRPGRRRVLRALRAATHASAPLPFGARHANLVSRDHLVP